jgi:hypothetical protein
MKTIILKGQEIKVGSQVRFIDDRHLYDECEGIVKPEVGKVYTVRAFTKLNGFYLEEVKNDERNWVNDQGEVDDFAEPGFAAWRFEPAQPLRKKKIVNIEILPMVEERLELPSKTKIKVRPKVEDLELA